jgi:hypothetical protein
MKLLNISPAAARENVRATIRSGSVPPKMSFIRRVTSENVLPVPADASITVSLGKLFMPQKLRLHLFPKNAPYSCGRLYHITPTKAESNAGQKQ